MVQKIQDAAANYYTKGHHTGAVRDQANALLA